MDDLEIKPDGTILSSILQSEWCNNNLLATLPLTVATCTYAFKFVKTKSDLDNCFEMYRRLSEQYAHQGNEDSTQTTSLLERPTYENSQKQNFKREIVLNLLLDACIKLGQVERAVDYVELILQKKLASLV